MRLGFWVVALSLTLMGSQCKNGDTVISGSIYEVTDATLATCQPYLSKQDDKSGRDKHTCLLIANPYKHILRVFDVTENQFILAPIGYYPLAVQVGSHPERVSAWPKVEAFEKRAFVLDTLQGRIFSVSTMNESNDVASFISRPKELGIQTAISPRRMVVAPGPNNTLWAFITFKEPQLQAIRLDPPASGPNENFLVDLSFHKVPKVADLAVDAEGKRLMLSGGSSFLTFSIADVIQKNSWLLSGSLVAVEGEVIQLANSKRKLDADEENLVLVISQTRNPGAQTIYKAQLFGTDRAVADQKIGEVTLPSMPLAVYLPEGEPSTCCNGEKLWAAVLTATGELIYLKLTEMAKPADKNEAKIGATVNVAKKSGVVPTATTGAVKILGGDYINPVREGEDSVKDGQSCHRKMFLIYSAFIASVCEGDANKIVRVDLR